MTPPEYSAAAHALFSLSIQNRNSRFCGAMSMAVGRSCGMDRVTFRVGDFVGGPLPHLRENEKT